MADVTKTILAKFIADTQDFHAKMEKIVTDSKKAERSVKESTGSIGQAFGGIASQFAIGTLAANALQSAISGVTKFITSSYTEFIDAAKANVQYTNSLRVMAGATTEQISALSDYADALKTQVNIDDDVIKSTMAVGASLGITTSNMRPAIEGAVGLNKALGIDLETGMRMLAQATEGNFMALGKYIPELKSVEDPAQKAAILQKTLGEMFAYATSTAGDAVNADEALAISISDLKKEIGSLLNEVIAPGIQILREFMELLDLSGKSREKMQEDATANSWNLLNKNIKEASEKLGIWDKVQKDIFGHFGKQTGTDRDLTNLSNWFIEFEMDSSAFTKNSQDFKKAYSEVLAAMKIDVPEPAKGLQIVTKKTKEHTDAVKKDTEAITAKIKEYDGAAIAVSMYYEELSKAIALDNTKKASAITERKNTIDTVWLDFLAREKKANDETAASVKLHQEAQEKLQDAIQGFANVALKALSVMGDLGILSKELAADISGLVDGVANFSAALIKGNPFAIAAAGIGLLGDAIKLLDNIFGGDGPGEAIDRLAIRINDFTNLTTKQEEELRKLAETMGGVENAWAAMLDETIKNADIFDVSALGAWAGEIENIFANIKYTHMSLKDAASEMGDAFTELITRAVDLGAEGSNAILQLLQHVKDSGLEVPEIADYIAKMGEKALGGYKGILDALIDPGVMEDMKLVFGGIKSDAFDAILATQKKIADNADMVNAIKNASDMLAGMSATARLTGDEFKMFEKTATSAYDALIKRGFSSKEALVQMAPLLAKLQFLSGEYGIELDPETKRLIEEAKQSGIDLSKIRSQEELQKEAMETQKKQLEEAQNVVKGQYRTNDLLEYLAMAQGYGDDAQGMDGSNPIKSISASSMIMRPPSSDTYSGQMTANIYPGNAVDEVKLAMLMRKIYRDNVSGIWTEMQRAH
jgi:hypothetical protein